MSDNELANPDGQYVLHERQIPGGRVAVDGTARLGDLRVDVQGTSGGNRVKIFGELPQHGIHQRREDPHLGSWGAWGAVDFGRLDRFWLTRTSTFDTIDEDTPLPGMLTQFEGEDVGVADTCGTVSLDGVPQLQLLWRGNDAPADGAWVPNGVGSFTRLIDRREDSMVTSVEWTAIWRGYTVTIAAIEGPDALIFVDRRLPPEFPDLEVLPGFRRAGWSATVPYRDLSLRTWTRRERPLGFGILSGYVGLVRGRTCLLRPSAGSWARPSPGIVAQKLRGETVTAGFALHARSGGPNWLWRAGVDEDELTGLRRVTATTVWDGEVRTVLGFLNESQTIYLESDVTVGFSEVTAIQYSVEPLAQWDDIGDAWIPSLPPVF
jgi:hypothetical protein